MKPILLLNDEPETVRLMLGEATSGGVAGRETEAGAIRVRDVSTAKNQRKPALRFHHQSTAR